MRPIWILYWPYLYPRESVNVWLAGMVPICWNSELNTKGLLSKDSTLVRRPGHAFIIPPKWFQRKTHEKSFDVLLIRQKFTLYKKNLVKISLALRVKRVHWLAKDASNTFQSLIEGEGWKNAPSIELKDNLNCIALLWSGKGLCGSDHMLFM